MLRRIVSLWIVTALWTACGDDDGSGSDDAGTGPSRARFELHEGERPAFGELPFPSDLFLDASGAVDVGALHATAPVWESVRTVVNGRRGFCTTCSVYFPIEGAVDRSSLPSDATDATTASPTDPIVMLDTDPTSPARGRLLPLRVEHNARDGLLAVRPARGVVLAPNRQYAVALTDAIRGADGGPLAPDALFAAVRDRAGDGAGVEAARAVLGPALDALSAAGVDRARIVAATAFTTWDPAADVDTLASIAEGTAPSPATLDRIWSGAELDALFGTPSENRPGWDVEPAPGTAGTVAVAHETVAFVLTGGFTAPRVVEGGADATTAAYPRRAADGAIEPGPAQRVPFTLVIPAGADVTALPVVIFHTGIGDTRNLVLAMSDTFGRAGFAILSVEPHLQGERAHGATDARHDLRETATDTTLGPDGLHEANPLDVIPRQLGLAGGDETIHGSPAYYLGTLLQQVADDLAAIRFAHEGDLSALAAADPMLAGLRFDPAHVVYVGGFMGAAIGALVYRVANGVDGFVLVYPPGSWVEVFTEAPVFRRTYEIVFAGALGLEGGFDEETRRLSFHPALDLYRWVIEPVEPLAIGPRYYAEGTPTRADLLVVLARCDEWVTAATSESFLAAAAIPGNGVFSFASVTQVTAPIAGNVTSAGTAITSAAWQHDADHFAILASTDTRTVTCPAVPPFVPMPEETHTQPIGAVHGQIEAFLRSTLAPTPAVIGAP